MAQVSTQAELRQALASHEAVIQPTQDLDITSPLTVDGVSAISSPDGSTFTLRKTASFSGALFMVSTGGDLTLRNIILDGAQAGSYQENIRNRTLVQVQGGALHLTNGAVIRNNSSYQEGGGVYLSGNAAYTNTFTMDGDARITGCTSRTSGGGLMLAARNAGDSVAISGQAVIQNNRAANGGGIYLRPYVQGVGINTVIGDQVRIMENAASASGGGIFVSGYTDGGGLPVVLTLQNDAGITQNTAQNGGGVYFYGYAAGDQLNLNSGTAVSENTVSGNGGGVYWTSPAGGAAVTIGGNIDGNTAGTGGGVYLLTETGGSFTVDGGKITGNKAENGISGNGGGLWIQNNALNGPLRISVTDGDISQNTATAQGGGAFIMGGTAPYTLNMAGTNVQENSADGNGGGLYFGTAGGGTAFFSQSVLSNNQSGRYGGGMYFANSVPVTSALTFDIVQVENNTAAAEGGGLRLASGGGVLNVSMTAVTASGNIADTSSGGGIWCGGANIALRLAAETVVSGNTTNAGNGGGVYFNSEGGALLLSDNAKVTNNRADVTESSSGNRGGGIYAVPGSVTIQDTAEISGNSALKYGGGVGAAQGSSVTMTGGNIHSNRASQQGGGVWSQGGSTLQQSGGDIYLNTAQIGGGIYNAAGGSAVITGDAQFGAGGLNTAPEAPGIYNAGTLYTGGSRDWQNGLYLENRGAAARLRSAMEQGAVVQLDNTGYVAPNPEGTPILVAEGTAQYPTLTQTDADAFRKPVSGFEDWGIRLSDDGTQVLLAPDQYTIQYENLLGAENPNPTAYTAYTPDILLLDPVSPAEYRFEGWYDAETGGSRVTVIPQGSTGDRTLYARWSISHAIVYEGNDAGGSVARRVPEPRLVEDGGSIALSTTKPLRDGYRFAGWNTSPDGTGTAYSPGSVVKNVTGEMHLYAQWVAVGPEPTTRICYCSFPSCLSRRRNY